MPKQGWDLATFSCGKCQERFEAKTETEYAKKLAKHKQACEKENHECEKADECVMDEQCPHVRHCEIVVARESGE